MTSTNDIPRTRVIQLDILRGVAILLVLFRHSAAPSARSHRFQPVADLLYHVGWTGVDLFFVLSGFLIGGLLFKEILATGHLDVRRFLVRRGFKIWPSYFLLVAVVAVELIWQHGASRAFREILPNLLHLQNYLASPRGFTWSLAVEEHFYLALPLFLLLVLRGGPQVIRGATIPIAAAVVALGCLTMRILTSAGPFEPDDASWPLRHLYPTHLRIDSLFFGVLLAYVYHLYPRIMDRIGRQRIWLMVASAALLAPAIVASDQGRFIRTLGYTFLYLGYGALLIALLYTPPGVGWAGRIVAGRPAKTLALVGVYSYAMYLWQFDLARIPVIHFVLPWAARHLHNVLFWWVVMGTQIVLTFVAGVIMARLVEDPALAVRDRLFPARAGAPATHAGHPARQNVVTESAGPLN